MWATLQKALKKLDRIPIDIVGLDFGTTALKCVRFKKTPSGPVLVAADILPAVALPDQADAALRALSLPKSLMASYAALAVPSELAVIKVLNFPGEFTAATESLILTHMGLENPSAYRVNYKILVNGHARSESRVLAVGYPTIQAGQAPRYIPSGSPAPYSLEISGLATLSAFVRRLDRKSAAETMGHLEIGERSSLFCLFSKGVPVLIRKFEFGVETVMNQVKAGLGVAPQVAADIVASGSIDISHWVSESAQPFIKQLLVSRDFVERRENCRIRQFYFSGGGSGFLPLRKELEQAFDLEFLLWNPLEGIPAENAVIGESVRGQECRLTAAVGVALAVLETP